MADPKVAIVMGSASDLPIMEKATGPLGDLGVPFEVRVLSAHRTPDAAREFAHGAAGRGIRVIIAGAGGSAALAGTLAAHSDLPVIGVPIDATPLSGQDALYSTVQMPPGFPVAAVAIGSWGAHNAALLAARILATADEDLAAKVAALREGMAAKTLKADEEVRGKFAGA